MTPSADRASTPGTATTSTLTVPGASLAYDVRPAPDADAPALLLIGFPMGASGFAALADRIVGRTVVTYDPRGTGRSVLDDQSQALEPAVHADDLHRLIAQVGAPVDVFASSGGAVNALELVVRHPGSVRRLVAHEPPLATITTDAPYALAACRAVQDTYATHGFGAGMARFIALVMHTGELDEDFLRADPPPPAQFGLPTDDDGNRHDPLLRGGVVHATSYEPDVDALLASETRIVVAAGETSSGQLANRASLALAGLLGVQAVVFPGGHGGFQGGEHGDGDPDAFAARLREVLDAG